MSIISLPRHHTKHHPDEALLLDATVHAAPADRPRGVDAPRLGCKPGTSARVMRQLRDETTRHHMPADLVPLPLLVSVPLAPVARDRMSVVLWDIAAAYFAAGEPHAIRMALAPIAEQLAEVTF